MIFINYFKKICLVTTVNLIIVAVLNLIRGNLSIKSIGNGMNYMGIIMFFFAVFAITGAGSLSKGDARSHYIRSASGGDFNKMAGEYSKRSNQKTNNVLVLFCTAALCYLIGILISYT